MHLPSDLTDLRKRDLKDEDHSLSLEFSSGKVMQRRSYSYFDSQSQYSLKDASFRPSFALQSDIESDIRDVQRVYEKSEGGI